MFESRLPHFNGLVQPPIISTSSYLKLVFIINEKSLNQRFSTKESTSPYFTVNTRDFSPGKTTPKCYQQIPKLNTFWCYGLNKIAAWDTRGLLKQEHLPKTSKTNRGRRQPRSRAVLIPYASISILFTRVRITIYKLLSYHVKDIHTNWFISQILLSTMIYGPSRSKKRHTKSYKLIPQDSTMEVISLSVPYIDIKGSITHSPLSSTSNSFSGSNFSKCAKVTPCKSPLRSCDSKSILGWSSVFFGWSWYRVEKFCFCWWISHSSGLVWAFCCLYCLVNDLIYLFIHISTSVCLCLFVCLLALFVWTK